MGRKGGKEWRSEVDRGKRETCRIEMGREESRGEKGMGVGEEMEIGGILLPRI